jgi:hypothetical protein
MALLGKMAKNRKFVEYKPINFAVKLRISGFKGRESETGKAGTQGEIQKTLIS